MTPTRDLHMRRLSGGAWDHSTKARHMPGDAQRARGRWDDDRGVRVST